MRGIVNPHVGANPTPAVYGSVMNRVATVATRKKLIVVDVYGRERSYKLKPGHVITADRLYQMRQPGKETILPFDDGSAEGGLAHFRGKFISSIELITDEDEVGVFGAYGEDEV